MEILAHGFVIRSPVGRVIPRAGASAGAPAMFWTTSEAETWLAVKCAEARRRHKSGPGAGYWQRATIVPVVVAVNATT